jgi:hypothetical protein
MTTYIDSRIVSLSAESADIIENDTKLSSCLFYLPNLLSDEQDILYTQISVQTAQIPVSFYIVNIYNNILVFKKGLTGAIQTVAFSRGNYHASSFVTEFYQKTGLNLTLNKTNGKFTISHNQI